jgi:hypothetical protein
MELQKYRADSDEEAPDFGARMGSGFKK